MSDRLGAEIKYGKGDEQVRTVLDNVSATIGKFENAETQYVVLSAKRRHVDETIRTLDDKSLLEAVKAQIQEFDVELALLRSEAEKRKSALLASLKESAASLVQKGEA